MAKKRKSKLFRGNTTKMLARGISLPNLYAKIKDLDELQLEDKSALEAAALIQEERIEEEVLLQKGQDVWGLIDEVEDTPIRIQLGISNQKENVDSIEELIEVDETDFAEQLQKKYNAIASITEQNVSSSAEGSIGVANIFEASLPVEEEGIEQDKHVHDRRYDHRKREDKKDNTIFQKILSRVLQTTEEEEQDSIPTETRDLPETQDILKKQEIIEENPSENHKIFSFQEHYIEENFGLDILDSDLFDYHQNLGDISILQQVEAKPKVSSSQKYLLAQIDKGIQDEKLVTTDVQDEIPEGIFSLHEEIPSKQSQSSISLFSPSDGIKNPKMEPDFVETNDMTKGDTVLHDVSLLTKTENILAKQESTIDKLHFARPLLPIHEQGVPSVIVEELLFDDEMEDHSDEQTMLSVSMDENVRTGSVLYIDEGEGQDTDEENLSQNTIDKNTKKYVNTDIYSKENQSENTYLGEEQSEEYSENKFDDNKFDDISITDGIQIQLGEQEDTIVAEQAWDIPTAISDEFEQTIHENARPVPIRLKSKRAQRRSRVMPENFSTISIEELEEPKNPILDSQRITMGQRSSKFPLFLIAFIMGVLIFAFIAAC